MNIEITKDKITKAICVSESEKPVGESENEFYFRWVYCTKAMAKTKLSNLFMERISELTKEGLEKLKKIDEINT